jgi:hypothetical protein
VLRIPSLDYSVEQQNSIIHNNKIIYKNLPLSPTVKDDKQYVSNSTEIISLLEGKYEVKEINLHDNFFLLWGGHSLKGIQFLNRVHKRILIARLKFKGNI